ncbi:uncharacterized protein LOC105881571 [Microcebus murinus]|uniref:uncharacterized protein LOC105881571 n=1 Tax=Microcebus murinus TaxID=30608 RepID=UPI003F6C2973
MARRLCYQGVCRGNGGTKAETGQGGRTTVSMVTSTQFCKVGRRFATAFNKRKPEPRKAQIDQAAQEHIKHPFIAPRASGRAEKAVAGSGPGHPFPSGKSKTLPRPLLLQQLPPSSSHSKARRESLAAREPAIRGLQVCGTDSRPTATNAGGVPPSQATSRDALRPGVHIRASTRFHSPPLGGGTSGPAPQNSPGQDFSAESLDFYGWSDAQTFKTGFTRSSLLVFSLLPLSSVPFCAEASRRNEQRGWWLFEARGDTLQDLQWISETTESTEPYSEFNPGSCICHFNLKISLFLMTMIFLKNKYCLCCRISHGSCILCKELSCLFEISTFVDVT